MRTALPDRVGAAQAAAVIAVGAAAVSLIGGLGTYLYIRFTQHRVKGAPPAPRKRDSERGAGGGA